MKPLQLTNAGGLASALTVIALTWQIWDPALERLVLQAARR